MAARFATHIDGLLKMAIKAEKMTAINSWPIQKAS
jgi:hypothetical protein